MNRPDEMDAFERELKQRMRRVDPPEDFAARVMEAAAPNIVVMPKRVNPTVRMWAGSAIAAALVAGIFVGEQMHERSQKQKVEAARQQFDAAMRVTDHALDQTRAQLERAGLKLGD